MCKNSGEKPVYDLEERTFLFARRIRLLVKKIKLNPYNQDDIKQLIRSSGSIGANYIEANEALSKKDFYHRIKISRKEAKEAAYWIRMLLETDEQAPEQEFQDAYQEANELKKIFSATLVKAQ